MQKSTLFSLLFFSLFTCSYSKAETIIKTPTITNKDVDFDTLLKGKLLPELLAGKMKGMDGYNYIVSAMSDVDNDDDKDLFMQVIFKKGEVSQDAMVIYYNNELPAVDSTFKPSFSTDNYHQLGSQGGDPRPCSMCNFEYAEGNIFNFRANGKNFKLKLINEKGIGLKWEKQ